MEGILKEYHTEGGIYAHASAGCLHTRPILDLKTEQGVRAMHEIAQRVLSLTLRLGGAMASEHGDGLARGEWLQETYGDELIEAMRSLKRAADPHGLLNPGKMFDAPPMDQNLRYGASYRSYPWVPALDFAPNGDLATAIEQCNGQGVCRKDTGVMCPSFQATREEKYSTRGRANLLRSLITMGTMQGKPGAWDALSEREVFDALDLCLACKGCKAECPSGVDMAKLKFEFLSQYYERHARSLRDYVFGYFHITARLLSAIAPVVNLGSRIPLIRRTMASILQVTSDRPFPKFSMRRPHPRPNPGVPRVLFLRDAFTHYVEPHIEQAAYDVLAAAGFDVLPLQTMAACAPLLSKGFIGGARRQAEALMDEMRGLDPTGELPAVGLEPSELYAFRHEYVDLLPQRRQEIESRCVRTSLLDEFLIRSGALGALRIATTGTQIFFHPHCHQRAEGEIVGAVPSGTGATVELLRACGYDVELSEAGCCGMAGTFGYESEHYGVSQQVAELKLFPRLRSLEDALVAATGAACRMQIQQGTRVQVQHPVVWAARALEKGEIRAG